MFTLPWEMFCLVSYIDKVVYIDIGIFISHVFNKRGGNTKRGIYSNALNAYEIIKGSSTDFLRGI